MFISYASGNRDTVYRLAQELEKSNVTVWLSGDDPIFGLNWPRALSAAIRNGVYFIPCFSRESREQCNERMKKEVEVAISELNRAPHNWSWFIPVLLDDAKRPSKRINGTQYLSDLKFYDLHRGWDEGLTSIVQAVTASQSSLERVAELMGISASGHATAEFVGLSQLNEKTIFALLELLKSTRVAVRARCNDLHGHVGPLPAVAVSILAAALSDPQENVRRSAVHAFRTIKLDREELIVVVFAALFGSSPSLRDNVVNALRVNWVYVSETALSALNGSDAVIRSKVADILGEVGNLALPILATTAVDGLDAYTRWRAGRALERLGGPQKTPLGRRSSDRALFRRGAARQNAPRLHPALTPC